MQFLLSQIITQYGCCWQGIHIYIVCVTTGHLHHRLLIYSLLTCNVEMANMMICKKSDNCKWSWSLAVLKLMVANRRDLEIQLQLIHDMLDGSYSIDHSTTKYNRPSDTCSDTVHRHSNTWGNKHTKSKLLVCTCIYSYLATLQIQQKSSVYIAF